ncbi:MAG: SGNH/GDSL hydrolase family protein [Planctomycetota bacterium]
MPKPRRARWWSRLVALSLGLVLALALAELVLRSWNPLAGRARYESYFEDSDRHRVDYAQAKARGLVVEPGLPRHRGTWAPGTVFYMCYRGGRRPYMDARGCARVDINSLGIRDRADLTWEKPPGTRRVVCIGDSFTFGWGVSAEVTWVRLVETILRGQSGLGDLHTVNCGAAGALYVDEYWWALRDRFGRLEPDVVLVSLCLNDVALMPNTVALESPDVVRRPHYPLRILQIADAVYSFRHRFDLDPAIDWGQLLLSIDPGDPFYAAKAETPDMFWPSGGPQEALRAMRGWCQTHSAKFGVVVWPLFQNLAAGEHYPFRTLHRVVEDFCAAEAIPFLDLLPTFLGQRAEDLWVDPSDLHGNEKAHALAAPALATFVARLLGGT